jgi:hypothetical protein
MTRTLLAILAAAVAAIVAFNVLIRQYGDPARDAIERETDEALTNVRRRDALAAGNDPRLTVNLGI